MNGLRPPLAVLPGFAVRQSRSDSIATLIMEKAVMPGSVTEKCKTIFTKF